MFERLERLRRLRRIIINQFKLTFTLEFMTSTNILLMYLSAITLVTFFVYGIDKYKARKSKWRIPESTLLWIAVLGGSVGALVAMKVWHHKTLHRKFKYGIPAILIIQIVFALLIFMN